MRTRWRLALPAAVLAFAWLVLAFRGGAAQLSTPGPAALATCGVSATTAATVAPVGPSASPRADATPATTPIFQHLTDVPLPGSASRFDYQSLDEPSGRLIIAHMGADQVIVFDTKTRQVAGTVDGVRTPTGVLAVPAMDRIFAAAAGSHNVAVIDAANLEVVIEIGEIGFPDGLAYAPAARQIFVSDESGGGELVIDAATNRAVTTIDIGGEAGNTQYDAGSGCIVVAVQNRNQLAVIDPTTDRLVGRYDLDECETPHGFLIDAPRRLAFVTCEDNAMLLVVDLRTMAVLATHPVGEGPDVLAFDPDWRRLYVASESGIVTVFAERERDLSPIGQYEAPHAHSVAVDPATHLVYLPLENVDGTPVLRILEPMPPGG